MWIILLYFYLNLYSILFYWSISIRNYHFLSKQNIFSGSLFNLISLLIIYFNRGDPENKAQEATG